MATRYRPTWMECVLRAMGGRRGRVLLLVVVLRRRCSDEFVSVCLAASARTRLSAVPNAVTAGSACAGGDESSFGDDKRWARWQRGGGGG